MIVFEWKDNFKKEYKNHKYLKGVIHNNQRPIVAKISKDLIENKELIKTVNMILNPVKGKIIWE